MGAVSAMGGAAPASAAPAPSAMAEGRRLPPNPNHRAPGVAVGAPLAVLVPAASPAAVPVPAPAGANAPHVRTLKIPKRSAAIAPTMACSTAAMPVMTAVTTLATSDMTAPISVLRVPYYVVTVNQVCRAVVSVVQWCWGIRSEPESRGPTSECECECEVWYVVYYPRSWPSTIHL
ncbi:hypothetical protein BD414DRAFT_497273 [Trametes punicea]|nr:hypothetical protein BD414DRAFT_497273 [Trametes punicea]